VGENESEEEKSNYKVERKSFQQGIATVDNETEFVNREHLLSEIKEPN
jgi:hypothetical protein